MGELSGFGWICVPTGISSIISSAVLAFLGNWHFAGVAFAIAAFCGLSILLDMTLL